MTRIRRIDPALIHIEIPSAQENITFFRQFIKKPTNSILSLGWGITPREVVENLGDGADGIVGEMPTGLPGPVAPNAARSGLDRQVRQTLQSPDSGRFLGDLHRCDGMGQCGQGRG